MQNSNDIQEPVVSQNRIDQLGISNRATTKSRNPSREATSLRTKLRKFEEVCLTALDEKTMQEVRKRYKAILRQARSNKNDIVRQQNLVSMGGGQADQKESSDLGLALRDARRLFNDTSDLMKVNVLKAFEDYRVPYLPKSHQSKHLRLITSQFASHASPLNGPEVKLDLEGRLGDTSKWLSGAEAKTFIIQSHFAFQNSLQRLDSDLDKASGDQEATKSLSTGLGYLSDLGCDVLKATLICLHDKETFQCAPRCNTAPIKMLESKYDDMKKIYEQAQTDQSCDGTVGGKKVKGD